LQLHRYAISGRALQQLADNIVAFAFLLQQKKILSSNRGFLMGGLTGRNETDHSVQFSRKLKQVESLGCFFHVVEIGVISLEIHQLWL